MADVVQSYGYLHNVDEPNPRTDAVQLVIYYVHEIRINNKSTYSRNRALNVLLRFANFCENREIFQK